MAGKAQFVTTKIFGKVGRATMKPIYSRQYETNKTCNEKLSRALRAAICALITIINRSPPRAVKYRHDGEGHTIIYADAFYTAGDRRMKPILDESDNKNAWNIRDCKSFDNG